MDAIAFDFVAKPWLVLTVAAAAGLHCSRSSDKSANKDPPSASSPPLAAALQPGPIPGRTARLDGAHTTREILSALSKDCLPCAEQNGCLDEKDIGGSCELATGISKISGESETALCLDALRCIFTSKCANTGQESPCVCGQTEIVSCMDGRGVPKGSCVGEFKKDFGSDGKKMYDEFINKAYGDGRANNLIQCVMPLCPTCRIP
jgi:hypothetical protein